MIKNATIVGAGIDPADYLSQLPGVKRGDPQFVMNGGELSNFASNPARWIKGYVTPGSASTEWGDLVDCLLLDPERFSKSFAVSPATYPDTKTGEPKPWTMQANFCKAWAKEQGDKTIVKPELHEEGVAAWDVIQSDQVATELLDCSQKQVMVVGEFEARKAGISVSVSVPIKCLIDLVPDMAHPKYGGVLADFKTARSGSPFAWPRAVYDFGYATQAARELDLYNAAVGLPFRDGFHHLICENVAPFAVATQFLSHEFIDTIGRARYVAALRFYCQCLKSNHWPGYREMAAQMGAVVIEGWVECKPEAWMVGKSDYNAMPSQAV